MYTIDFNKYLEFLSWDVVYWGIKNDIISAESAVEYANKLIATYLDKDDPLLIELFILENVCKDEVLSLINKRVSPSASKECESLRTLRYIILDGIKHSTKNDKDVIIELENIYADFDYPQDMNPFIGYMPVENDNYNPSVHTQQENEQRLIEKFDLFLQTELEWLCKKR